MPDSSSLYPGKSRQIAVIGMILALLGFLLYSLNEFIVSFLGALIFYVLFRKFMKRLITIYRWKRWVAATLIIFISFLLIIIPLFGLIYLLIGQLQTTLSNPQDLMQGFNTLIVKINRFFDRQIFSSDTLVEYIRGLADSIPAILNTSILALGSLLMMYFLLYYLLVNTGYIEPVLSRYLPFTREGIQLLTQELDDMTKANAIAVPMIALAQGIVSTFGFWLFGMKDPLFWGVLTGCSGVLPVVGAGLIWAPAGIIMLATAESWQGIGILLYGTLIISLTDNFFRLVFARWFANVHPVITILGVIIGLQWFGLPGLVFGPLLIAYFFLLVKIYQKEFALQNKV